MTSDAKLTQSPDGMSDTPRTDAIEAGFAGWDKLRWIPHVVVQKSLAHARELERECKRLDDAINRACDRITDLQRPVDPRQSQPKCHSCGGWVKVEEGGICMPCHTEDSPTPQPHISEDR
jgi:hypothetical protein